MEKKTCAILGYGDRSGKYAQYALDHPQELEVVAVIDVAAHKLRQAKEVFRLSEERLFSSLDDFLSKNITCDFVINGTMDSLHYETTIKLLRGGNCEKRKASRGDRRVARQRQKQLTDVRSSKAF